MTLTCSANGYPAPTYTIKRQNTQVVSNGGKFEITNVQLSEEANTYSCETQNAEGSGPTVQLKITVLGKDQDYLWKAIYHIKQLTSVGHNFKSNSLFLHFLGSADFRGWERGQEGSGGGGGSPQLHLRSMYFTYW